MKSFVSVRPFLLEWAWLILCISSLTLQEPIPGQTLITTVPGTGSAVFLRFSLVCVALTLILPQLRRVPRFRPSPISLFLLYVMFGVASSLWSASFIASLGKSAELLAATLVVWITAARADAKARLRRLACWTLVEAVVGLLYVGIGNIFDPTEFHEYLGIPGLFPVNWSSPLIYANSVSQLGALVGLFCLANAFAEGRRRWLYGLGYLASAAFPVLAQGRTGMISFVVGSGLILARRFPIASALGIPLAAALASVALGHTLLDLFMRGQDAALFYSLSGRTTMWEAGWQAFLANPFFGSGFGVGGKLVQFSLAGLTHATSLHDGFLEVALGVGLFGFAIWAIAVIWSVWVAAAAYLRDDAPLFVVGMVVPATATLLSTGVGGWLDFFVQYFLATTALLWSWQKQRAAKAVRSGATPLAPALANLR